MQNQLLQNKSRQNVNIDSQQPNDIKHILKNITLKCTLFFSVFSIIFISIFLYTVITSESALFKHIKKQSASFLLNKVYSYTADKHALLGEESDRINVLLLGIGGKNHQGGDLTDTIIIASYKPSVKKLALISIPRDLLVYIPNYNWRKINHVYFFGEQQNPGKGGNFAQKQLSKIFNIPLHYYVVADFQGFLNVIDEIGGIEIKIENTIDDYRYPIPGKENVFPIKDRFEHFHLEKGVQFLDATTALKYCRSRLAYGIEGSDYARSKRQQKILMAVKEKILSYNTLLNIHKIKSLIKIAQKNVKTNFTKGELLRCIGFAKDFNRKNIINKVIDAGAKGPLGETFSNGVFVLQPKTGDFEELKFIVKNVFNPQKKFDINKRIKKFPPINWDKINTATKLASTSNQKNKLKINLLNGTDINGLAQKYKTKLKNNGYQIINIGNAPKSTYSKNIIYDLTKKGLDKQIKEYFSTLFSYEIKKKLPENLPILGNIIIILGNKNSHL